MIWKGLKPETDLATATTLAMSSEFPSMMQSSPWRKLWTLFQESKLELVRGRESAVEESCPDDRHLVSGGSLCDDMALGLETEAFAAVCESVLYFLSYLADAMFAACVVDCNSAYDLLFFKFDCGNRKWQERISCGKQLCSAITLLQPSGEGATR